MRDASGKVVRVELTTELRDYWRVLVEHEPARAADLVGGVHRPARDLQGVGRLNDGATGSAS